MEPEGRIQRKAARWLAHSQLKFNWILKLLLLILFYFWGLGCIMKSSADLKLSYVDQLALNS